MCSLDVCHPRAIFIGDHRLRSTGTRSRTDLVPKWAHVTYLLTVVGGAGRGGGVWDGVDRVVVDWGWEWGFATVTLQVSRGVPVGTPVFPSNVGTDLVEHQSSKV